MLRRVEWHYRKRWQFQAGIKVLDEWRRRGLIVYWGECDDEGIPYIVFRAAEGHDIWWLRS